MRKESFVAIVFTSLLFGGLAFYMFGDRLFDGVDQNSSKKEQRTRANKKRSSKVTSAPKVLASYRGVNIYDNGGVRQTHGRNTTSDGYNLGLKYQCVEFVKRFYYEHFNHKMPNSYGHAKDFFQDGLEDGALNEERNLLQFRQGGRTRPAVNDIVVVGASGRNSFGHVAIISWVGSGSIEVVQQNPGPGNPVREKWPLTKVGTGWKIEWPALKGWLRRA